MGEGGSKRRGRQKGPGDSNLGSIQEEEPCFAKLSSAPSGVRQRLAELFGNFVRPDSPDRAADGPSRAEGGGLARSGRLEARSRRPRLGRLGGRCRAAAAAQRTEATGGGMDYLTTFTGKSGRLLRGTASRLWGLGGGGEARQVRFEDYLREPAPGDPGCGPEELRPPSPASPEGPGESPRPRGASPPGARTGTGTGEAAPRAGVRARRCAGARSLAAAWWPFLPRAGATDSSRFSVRSSPLFCLLQPVVTSMELDFQNAVCAQPLLWSVVFLGASQLLGLVS